jgi:hypothetical protein
VVTTSSSPAVNSFFGGILSSAAFFSSPLQIYCIDIASDKYRETPGQSKNVERI